jgi:heme/copper-type cytochrome/quinol oxidase subunit 4
MNNPKHVFYDRTPGVEEHEPTASYLSYTVGLALAIIATIVSFIVAQTNLLWPPGIPVGLIVLALAQIGVHLVFFLHLGSGPDSTNNILALAFRRADRLSRHRRLYLDHRQSQHQHDVDAAIRGKSPL